MERCVHSLAEDCEAKASGQKVLKVGTHADLRQPDLRAFRS